MHGSAYKRIALLLSKLADKGAEEFYRKSFEAYRSAMADAGATGMNFYWTATQSLSLQAIKNLGTNPDTYRLARALAEHDARTATTNSVKAWAHATLAELDVLRVYHAPGDVESGDKQRDELREHCAKVAALMGPESFHVGSTLRQFLRYRDNWHDSRWAPLVDQAIDALQPPDKPGQGEHVFAYPERK